MESAYLNTTEKHGGFIKKTTDELDYDEPFETLKQTYASAASTQSANVSTTQSDDGTDTELDVATSPGFSTGPPEDSILYFVATISNDGDIELGTLTQHEASRPVKTDADGSFRLVGTDDEGSMVSSKRFTASNVICDYPNGLKTLDRAPVSFAASYPVEVTGFEVRRQSNPDGATSAQTDEETLVTFDPRVETLRGELELIPNRALEADDPESVRSDLHDTIDEVASRYDAGEPLTAARMIQTELRPALDTVLADDYDADEPIERSRESVVTTVDDAVVRSTQTRPIIRYISPDETVEIDGVRQAVDDWRVGDIDTEVLRRVIDYRRSGDPVE